MSPILGIYASQISGHLSTNNFSSIATQTVGSGGASSVTFSAIPSTYTHLQIRCNVLMGTTVDLDLQFNSDTGANYAYHALYGTGSAAGSLAATSTSNGVYFGQYRTGATSACGAVVDILDYTNVNKNKTVRALSGIDTNSTNGIVFLTSGLWMNTSAISNITIYSKDAISFAQYSSFALYGIR